MNLCERLRSLGVHRTRSEAEELGTKMRRKTKLRTRRSIRAMRRRNGFLQGVMNKFPLSELEIRVWITLGQQRLCYSITLQLLGLGQSTEATWGQFQYCALSMPHDSS